MLAGGHFFWAAMPAAGAVVRSVVSVPRSLRLARWELRNQSMHMHVSIYDIGKHLARNE